MKKWAVGIGLAIVFCGVVLWLHRSTAKEDPVVRALRQELYLGQSSIEVKALLDRLGVEYRFEPWEHRFVGVVRDVDHGPIVQRDVSITVTMDTENRVASIALPDVFTGP